LGVSSLDLGRWHAGGLFYAALRFPRDGIHASREGWTSPLPQVAGESCVYRMAAAGISLLSFVQCGEMFSQCGDARHRRPVVGVSSLDLGHWLAGDPFSFPERDRYGLRSEF